MTKVNVNIIKQQLPLHVMMIPALIFVVIFNYIPMFGVIMAFQDFIPTKGFLGSHFIGLQNFKYFISMPDAMQVLWNTVYLTFSKLFFDISVVIIFSLLLNELKNRYIKKTIQTVVFFPYFLSWVILGGIVIDLFSPSTGIVNTIIKAFGFQPIFFLAEAKAFPLVLILTSTWKGFGYLTVLCLAALTSISPELYEAAEVDGAGRFKQMLHITIPGIIPIIFVMLIIDWAIVSNGQMEQILVLYNPLVYKTGDIIDTFVYRLGIFDAQYGVAAAAGLLKSVVSTAFILAFNQLGKIFAGYKMV